MSLFVTYIAKPNEAPAGAAAGGCCGAAAMPLWGAGAAAAAGLLLLWGASEAKRGGRGLLPVNGERVAVVRSVVRWSGGERSEIPITPLNN